MNWDSFFSGVSQGTASILGVVLAFIISKILSESSNFLVLERQLKDTLIDTLIDSGEINCLSKELKLDWHDKYILRNHASFHALIDDTSFNNISDTDLEVLLRERVPCLFTYEDRAAYARECEAGYQQIRRTSSITTFGLSTDWQAISDVESEYNNLEVRASIIIAKIENQERSLRRYSSSFVKLGQIILASWPAIVLGVIYPLHFLPLPNNVAPQVTFSLYNAIDNLTSLKGVFISTMVLTASVLVWYFYNECRVCKNHCTKILDEIPRNAKDIRSYCSAFRLRQI